MTSATTAPLVVQVITAGAGNGKGERVIALADNGRLYELRTTSSGDHVWTALPELPAGS